MYGLNMKSLSSGLSPSYLHVQERIVVQVAVVVYIWLHPPVVVILLQQWVPVNEAAEVAAHVVVRLPAAIQNSVVFHRLPGSCSSFRGDPCWVAPMFLRNFAIQAPGFRGSGRPAWLWPKQSVTG